jgi:hypothetical protein
MAEKWKKLNVANTTIDGKNSKFQPWNFFNLINLK